MITVGKSAQLAAAIATAQSSINAAYAARIAAGFNYQGAVYQIDDPADLKMTAIYALLTGGIANPHGGAWRTMANTFVAMDDAAVTAFILAAKTYVQALLAASWSLKDGAAALTSLTAVWAYDITADWPANDL